MPAPTQRRESFARYILVVAAMAGCAFGCAIPDAPGSRDSLARELRSRTGHTTSTACSPSARSTAPGVNLADGLNEQEAVATALWNNPRFHSTLAQLGVARGDLITAGQLRNPQFMMMIPGGGKQLEWMLFAPVDTLVLRKHRVEIGELEFCRVSKELVQNGLDLVRDVRVAYADFQLAARQLELADETVELRRRIAALADKRLDAGDISELEAMTARVDAQQARADRAGLDEQVEIVRERLTNLMGLSRLSPQFAPAEPQSTEPVEVTALDIDSLCHTALQSRPDLRAASFARDAAEKGAELSEWEWFILDVSADQNSGSPGPSNMGPGLRLDIPLFHRNEGGRERAQWLRHAAIENHAAVRDQILMEVRSAHAGVRQATSRLTILREKLLGSIRETQQLAERSYEGGGSAYFLVLQTSGQYLAARARELQLEADLSRAVAELERSIGRRVPRMASPTAPTSPTAPGPEATATDAALSAGTTGLWTAGALQAAGTVRRADNVTIKSKRSQSSIRLAVASREDEQFRRLQGRGVSEAPSRKARESRESRRKPALTLTPRTVERPGISSVPVEYRSISRHGRFGGDVVVRQRCGDESVP